MKALFSRLWNDEASFTGYARALLIVLAGLFAEGTIPTGIDGGGPKVGLALVAIAGWLTAGNKTPTDSEGFAKPNPATPVKPDTVVVTENVEQVGQK